MELTFPAFDSAELENVQRCLDSKWVTQGPFVREFETEVCKVHAVDHGLATTSCTAALHLAVLALGLGPGDEVIVPAFTWITSANCAEYAGAKVVFVDVDLHTYNIDPAQLERAVTPATKAIVAVHLFGLAAEMDAICDLAASRGIAVIEDAACAIGTTFRGRPVGGIGDLGCFSFHPRKVVTTGEGGMVTTNDAELAGRVDSFRNHGATGLEDDAIVDGVRAPWAMATFDNLGYNLRMSDIQAAVGVAQMHKLRALLAERRAAARYYLDALADCAGLSLPHDDQTEPGHSYQSFVVRVADGGQARRNAIMLALAQHDISTRPGTHAVHTLGYYRDKYSLRADQFPNALAAQNTTITLPLFPGMTHAEQDEVVDRLKDALKSA